MSNLAILGGSPVFDQPERFIWPLITKETEKAVVEQLNTKISIYDRSGIYEKFENSFSGYHGLRYSLTTNAGTTALLSMFFGAGIKAGDEVIVPAYTFFATVSPLFFLGAIPVLCDCDASGNIDPDALAILISARTRAVIVTHMWGIPCEMGKISDLCKQRNLILLEDCSHAHGAIIADRLIGTWGSAAAWSLQGQKIISGGELGVLATNDEEIYYRAQLLGHFNKRCMQEIPPDHQLFEFAVTGMGMKLRANVLAVAMAYQQFKNLDPWLAQKEVFAELMDERLAKIPGLNIPVRYRHSAPSWYAYVFHYDASLFCGVPRSLFQRAVWAEGAVELDVPESTCPLARLPLFQKPGRLFANYDQYITPRAVDFPAAEQFCSTALKLPVWTQPTDTAVVLKYLDAIEKVAQNCDELLENFPGECSV